MSISSYGKRFLETEKFLDLCNNLDIEALDWRIEAEWLEYLEKEKLLFPFYRIVFSKSYATYFHKHRNYLDFEIPKKWAKFNSRVNLIEDEIDKIFVFNILDKKKFKNKFLQIPHLTEYIKWNYELHRKNFSEKIKKQNNYYQHWQIYHLYEVTKSCSQEYLLNIFREDYTLEIFEKGLNPKNFYRYTINRKHYHPEYFLNNTILFDMLSFYVSSIYHCNQVPIHMWLEYHKLDENKLNAYELKREIRIAKCTIKKYNLDKQQIIDFIKMLSSRYFIYEADNMGKMNLMLKKDIEAMCKLLEDGFETPTENLIGIIKKVREHYTSRPLEYILRGEIAKAKDNAFRSLRNTVGKTIKYQHFTISEFEVEEFLEFCDSNSMASIFLEINRYYLGNQNYYSIIQNLIALAMIYEGFLRILLEKSKITVEGNGLLDALKYYYKDAKWYSVFMNADNRKIMYQKKDLVSLTFEINNQKFHKNNSYDEIIKSLYVLLLLRNNIAHNPFNISFKKKHPNFYKEKIIELIWFSWQYAKENFPLAIKTESI